MEVVKPLLILSLALFTATQQLPTYGTIDDIKALTRVYVHSDNQDSRKRIINSLTKDKRIEVVNSPESAEFFLEYSGLSREVAVTGERTKERQQQSQMVAYVVRDKEKVIVWSDTRSRETSDFLGMKMYDSGRNESELTSKFLKALKKARTP